MARISGVDLPRDKRVEIGLTYIYGIGRKTSNDILAATGVNPDIRVKDLTDDDVAKLREYIDHNVTVNIIKDNAIAEKKTLKLPKKITNVIHCKNPRCITSIEQELPHIFYLADEKTETYRCQYCEEKYSAFE